jgi:hypothetical protein
MMPKTPHKPLEDSQAMVPPYLQTLAYDEGFRSFKDASTRPNPHEIFSDLWLSWYDGYVAAGREYFVDGAHEYFFKK